VAPAIEMVIGDWHVDELGVRTRDITAREQPCVVGCGIGVTGGKG